MTLAGIAKGEAKGRCTPAPLQKNPCFKWPDTNNLSSLPACSTPPSVLQGSLHAAKLCPAGFRACCDPRRFVAAHDTAGCWRRRPPQTTKRSTAGGSATERPTSPTPRHRR